MIKKSRFPVLCTILVLTVTLFLAEVEGGGMAKQESENLQYESDEGLGIDITINISNPVEDITNVLPGVKNSTLNPLSDLKEDIENITDFSSNNEMNTSITFQNERPRVKQLITGTKTGIESSPTLISMGVDLGTGDAREIIAERVKVGGGAGTSVIASLLERTSGNLFTLLPVQGPGKNVGPEVSSEQFIATTMMSALIMAFASIFSSGQKFPIFLPLYSRIKKDEVLENPTRGSIYRMVAHNPGVDLLSIKNALSLSNGVLAHHIHTLERERYLRSIRDGRYRRFYIQGTRVEQGSSIERFIMREIENNPMINQSQLARNMKLSRQAINYHIQKLVKKGIIITEKKGRETHCRRRDS